MGKVFQGLALDLFLAPAMIRGVRPMARATPIKVTNPPINPLRETHVMSLQTHIGAEFSVESPVLTGTQMIFLRECFAPGKKIDITFPATEGVAGALRVLERIRNGTQQQRLINKSWIRKKYRATCNLRPCKPRD